MGMSNLLLSMEENKDLNKAMELKFQLVKNPNSTNNGSVELSPSVSEDQIKEESTTKPRLGGLASVDVTDHNEGFKTPTSPKRRIPPVMVCPPAPRKSREAPWTLRTKRKASCQRRVLLDFSNEVEAMYPLTIQKNFYSKIRKISEENNCLGK